MLAWKRYYWLNVVKLCSKLIDGNSQLILTKYFTARIAGPTPRDSIEKARKLKEKRERQSVFGDAIHTLNDCRIYEGHYLPKAKKCLSCGAEWTQHEEKMTDVNIATELLCDAFSDGFDTALLISGDSDLTPPALAVRQFFPEKQIIVAFPPRRHSVQLKRAATNYFTIGRTRFRDSQLPQSIRTTSGHVLVRPSKWE